MNRYLSIPLAPIIHAARRAQHGSIQDYRELRRLVEDRSPEQFQELLATMWLGRGFDGETVADWPHLIEQAARHDAEYVCSKAQLAEYLEAGQRKLCAAVLEELRT